MTSRTWIAVTGILVAFAAMSAFVGSCGDDDGGATDTYQGTTVADCFKIIGWQSDASLDADMNGIAGSGGELCYDAETVDWYEESATTNEFTRTMAWYVVGTCGPRAVAPAVDAPLCTFTGTHLWETIPGADPSLRMALEETITTVTGDFDGDGTDDKCGPASALEGTTTRYVVLLDGACTSGTTGWMWQPLVDDSEAFPGNIYATPAGAAFPTVVCTAPGTVGPADHIPARAICPPAQHVSD